MATPPEVRETFSPGMFSLFEDVDGLGHILDVVSPTPLTIMALSIAD